MNQYFFLFCPLNISLGGLNDLYLNIETIQNELLKSPKLTGQWEKKLRDIEQGKYNAQVFLKEMETLVTTVVKEVKNRQSVNRFSEADMQLRKQIDTPNCPKCKTGKILKGKDRKNLRNTLKTTRET